MADRTAMEPAVNPNSLSTPRGVRVRKTTASFSNTPLPTNLVPSQDQDAAASLPPTLPVDTIRPFIDSATFSSPPMGSLGRGGRRRGATITERLFSNDTYSPLEGESTSEVRRRSGSLASTERPVRAATPVKLSIKGRRASTSGGEEVVGVTQAETVVTGSGARRGSTARSTATGSDTHHAEDEVDVLEVLDQSVSTTAALTNIQGAFWPASLSRQPVCELEPSTQGVGATTPTSLALSSEEEEETDPLDAHLAKLLKKQKRKELFRQTMRGVWTFLKTPIGVFFGIYGVLVVFWGAALVLILVGAVPMSSYNKTLWVEISAQILTGLFTITSLFPLPWRLRDTWQIIRVAYYARQTHKRRQKLHLPPLRDPNDLPDPANAEFWIGPGGEKLTGPKAISSTAPPKVKKSKKDGKHTTMAPVVEIPSAEVDRAVNLELSELSIGSKGEENLEEEIVVLTDKEEESLRDAQMQYARAQTWFRPHTTPTHHATPITTALWVSLLLVGNSAWQAFLCGVMWGITRFNRPPWTTAIGIVASFGCGIGAAILIYLAGENTKRKREVTRRVWAMLKKDEEALELRRKEATAKREAEKISKRPSHKATPSISAVPDSPLPSTVEV